MKKIILGSLLAAIAASPAIAQDLAGQEVVVTAARIDQDDFSDYMPAVGLRRNADFLVMEVIIRGDTRDADQRESEIRAMLRRAIERAERSGVELAQGDYIVTRLTVENADEIELRNDRRPDSERITFLVKAPLADQSVEDAQATIKQFIESVPEVGRAEMEEFGDPSLSVVRPDSFREQIIALVAQDARRQADVLGAEYAVELTGLNMPVQWARSGPGEVLLYIPYELKVVPRP